MVFSANLVNLIAGDQYQPEFVAINPKSTIPVLVLDGGEALTSFQGICWWLAMNFPKAKLLPESTVEQAKALDLLGYIVNTIHGEGFTRIFTPKVYCDDDLSESCQERLQQKGREIVAKGFNLVNDFISDRGYYLTPNINVVDAALFYVEFWADKLDLPLPQRCQAHYQWMKQRPAVKQVLAEEGYRI